MTFIYFTFINCSSPIEPGYKGSTTEWSGLVLETSTCMYACPNHMFMVVNSNSSCSPPGTKGDVLSKQKPRIEQEEAEQEKKEQEAIEEVQESEQGGI